MKRFFALAVISLLLLVAGCGGSSDVDDIVGDGTTGTIQGYVKAPNGTDPIMGAGVAVQGTALAATSDASGYYVIQNVPAGPQTVVIAKGAFRAQTTVSVASDSTVTAPVSSLAPIGRIGVVPGNYDAIGNVLNDLGITYVDLQGVHLSDVFANPSKLSEYAVIFFACGGDHYLDPTDDAAIIANIRNFVNGGGQVYMSDWASALVEVLFPGKVTMLGNFGDAQTVTGTILNPDLQALLGKDECSIVYDLGAWSVIDSVASDVQTDISGTFTYTDYESLETITATKPLLLHFNYGTGSVVLTTFHNEANVTADSLAIIEQLTFGF